MKILCKNSCVFENKHFSFSFFIFNERRLGSTCYLEGIEDVLKGHLLPSGGIDAQHNPTEGGGRRGGNGRRGGFCNRGDDGCHGSPGVGGDSGGSRGGGSHFGEMTVCDASDT